MKLKNFALIAIATVAAFGCSGDTSVSAEVSPKEIQEGIDRRLAAVDKLNVPEAQKERMRQQIRGSQGGAATPDRK